MSWHLVLSIWSTSLEVLLSCKSVRRGLSLDAKQHPKSWFLLDLLLPFPFVSLPILQFEQGASSLFRFFCIDVDFPLLFVSDYAHLTRVMSVSDKEDMKSVVELVTNAKQVMSTVEDAALKVAEYAKLRSRTYASGKP
ncbi:hypothetical protein Ancab_022419 [Ancistrocladus abbreviatus]